MIDEIAQYDVLEAVVRVIITATPENETFIRERDIKEALGDAAFVAAIQRDIEYPVRRRLGVERPEGLSPLELLERYLIAKEYGPERMAVLREFAERIFANDL